MSGMFRPRNLAILGAGVIAIMFVPFPGGTPKVFDTPASKSIGDRWSSGGGSTNHTPGAATKRGDKQDVMSNQKNPSGMGSTHFEENVANQRPGEPGPFDKAWNKSHYGSEKGK
ncbi:hypothetical protein BJ546DRAFT_259638 [Cryomyces antarcticus]